LPCEAMGNVCLLWLKVCPQLEREANFEHVAPAAQLLMDAGSQLDELVCSLCAVEWRAQSEN